MSEISYNALDRPKKPSPVPLFLTARIDIQPGGRFRLDGSEPAIIVPVRDRYGCICDLVAYRNDDPGSWLLKEGARCPILGARELAGAEIGGGPIPLFPTPADWVDAGGCGVCILDWGAPLFNLFWAAGEIELRHLDCTVQRAIRDRLWKNFQWDIPRIYSGRKRGSHVE